MKSRSRKEAACRSHRHSRVVEKLDQLIENSKPVYSSYLADQLGFQLAPFGRSYWIRPACSFIAMCGWKGYRPLGKSSAMGQPVWEALHWSVGFGIWATLRASIGCFLESYLLQPYNLLNRNPRHAIAGTGRSQYWQIRH